jgi:hypothetical protein
MMEYYQYGTDGLWTARPTTEHVPTYVEGRPIKSVVIPEVNTVFTLARTEAEDFPFELYVYNYFREGNQLTQSAWQKWTFNSRILDINVLDDNLQVTTLRPETDLTFSESIQLRGTTELEDALGHPVRIDSLEEVAADFEPTDDRVKVRLGGTHYVGYEYVQRYVFSQMFVRQQDKVFTRGRLQLGRLFLNFTNTTSFKVLIERDARVAREIEFSGRTIGSLTNKLGVIPVNDGSKSIPIHARSDTTKITILNDTPYDSVFQSCDWEGMFTQRARRI